MHANSLSWRNCRLSASAILAVGLILAVSRSDQAPAQPAPAKAPAAENGKERRFDSTQPFLVFQIVADRSQPKLLGITPTPDKKGIVVPEDETQWFVVPTGPVLGAGVGKGPGLAAGNPMGAPGAMPVNPGLPGKIGGAGMVGQQVGMPGAGIAGLNGGLFGNLPVGLQGGILGNLPGGLPGGLVVGVPGAMPGGALGLLGGMPGAQALGLGGMPAGLVGGALPPGFVGGIPGANPGDLLPKKKQEKPAPDDKKPAEKPNARIASDVILCCADDDAPLVVAQVVIPRLPPIKIEPPKIAPLQPGGQPKAPAVRNLQNRFPVTDASVQELADELKKNNITGIALENLDLKDSQLAIVAGCTGLKTLVLRNTSVTDAGLKELEKLPALRNLVLEGDELTGKGLVHLKGKSLQSLELSGRIMNQSLTSLQGLKELKVLRLRWTPFVNDQGIKLLAGMKNFNDVGGLESIELLGQAFTDQSIRELTKMKGLKRVRLYLTRVSSAGLDALSKMEGLTALTVDSCSDGITLPFASMTDNKLTVRAVPSNALGYGQRIQGITVYPGGRVLLKHGLQQFFVQNALSDENLTHLKNMTSLRELEIAGLEITDAGLASLQGLTALTSLKIDAPKITNKGLASLKDLTKLETLDFRCTGITVEGAASLRKLAALKTLYVPLGCSDQDLAAFRQALPQGAVVSRGNPYEELTDILGKAAAAAK